MKKLFMMIAALGLAFAFTAPALAAEKTPKTPTTKVACEKAKMMWDDATKTCKKHMM